MTDSTMKVDELVERLGDPGLTILDVRTHEEYSGEQGYPCDRRQGHIPGAVNVPVAELAGRAPDDVRSLVGLPEGAEIVVYCHSGSRSGLAAAALHQAGYRARNYEGSWHEWSGREDLPAS